MCKCVCLCACMHACMHMCVYVCIIIMCVHVCLSVCVCWALSWYLSMCKSQHYEFLPNLLHLFQVHLGNQETNVGLITFQAQPSFDYLYYVVLPVLAAVLLCAVGLLLSVLACCVCKKHAWKKKHMQTEG